ncbi:MAG: phosphoenolpyruvate carboxylase, partial [Rhodospirillales bacterium]|nr:phosphoenolpyruvate carboxylase [Rhodospirillales bacterium]
MGQIGELPVHELASLTRVFGLFFDLANLAEDRHRVRVLLRREREGRPSETINEAVEALQATDLSRDELRDLLSKLEFEPVFTAHPTEAKRRGVRRALRRLRRDLFMIDREHLLRGERHRLLRRMRRDMARLWYTDPVSARKPTVIEELERTLFAVHTLWRVGPNVIRRLRDAFEEEPDLAAAICRPLHFGNWIGGDRDGNPFVTCKVTQQTLQKLRSAAIRLHRRECRQAQRRLTLCAEHAALPQNLQQRIDETCERWPQLRDKIDRLHPQEWLARWLVIVDQRLRHSEPLSINGNANGQAVGDSQHGLAYRSGSEFADDVAVVRHALEETDLAELAQGALRRWEDRIAMFGLHMLRLDTRVNSTTLKQALTQLLANAGEGAVDYALLDEAQRQALLTAEPTDEIAHLADSALDESIVDLLDLFALLLRMCEAGGEEALGHIIISMTHQPSDVLAVLWLLRVAAKRAGIEKPVAMSVVPLFETIDDLQRAEAMMREMLGNPAYREHVRRCGDEQTCMIGYSDSAKDGGYLASNWALYRTQRSLADATEAYDVRLTVFHGRGGAIGRGGGPAARAILSLPAESVFGKLRITEQGEVIAERYDDPAIAGRHLEQLFWATLKLSARRRAGRPADADAFAKSLAQRSLEAYRRLTDGPLFEHYLHYCTALPIIENLPIGSRPSRRSGQARVEDLRAIPFTFAWNQVRMPINAFEGLGEAFA